MRLTFALRVILPAVTMALATGSAGAREARRTEGLDNRPGAATRGTVRRTSGGKNVLEKNQLGYLDHLMRDTFAFIDYAWTTPATRPRASRPITRTAVAIPTARRSGSTSPAWPWRAAWACCRTQRPGSASRRSSAQWNVSIRSTGSSPTFSLPT